MLRIPAPALGVPYQRQRTNIDGRNYFIRWALNQSTDSWTIDLSTVPTGDTPSVDIILGRKCFVGLDLLERSRSTEKPQGRLFVINADGSRIAPGENDFATGKAKLIYIEPGETL